MTKTIDWKKEFNERFRREDGLIDKYAHDYETGDMVAMPDAIEAFIEELLSLRDKELRERIEKLKNVPDTEAKGWEILEEKTGSRENCCPGDDIWLGYETGIDDVLSLLSTHNKENER